MACAQDIQKGVVFPLGLNILAQQGVVMAHPTLVTSSPLQSSETGGRFNSQGVTEMKQEGGGTFLKCGKQIPSVFFSTTCEGTRWPSVPAVLLCVRLSEQKTLRLQCLMMKAS